MFKGYRIWELPPNNQGIATLEMLSILEPYDLKAMGLNSRAVSASSHRGEEARVRRSRAVRRRRGSSHDAARAHALRCVHRRAAQPSRRDRTRRRASSRARRRRRARRSISPWRTAPATWCRSSTALLDEFGSGVVVPGTGFVLHDRGADSRWKRGCRTPSRRASVRSTR